MAGKKEKKVEKKNPPKVTGMKQALPVTIDGQSLTASWKIQKDGTEGFSTGSKGWVLIGKVVIDGVRCQVTGNIIIIGSKPESKKEKK